MKYDGRIRNSKRKNYFQEKWKMKVLVIQYCPTLWDPMDCSPPGPLSMGFSRQEYWRGLPLPLGGNPWTAHCGLRIDKNKTFLTVFASSSLEKEEQREEPRIGEELGSPLLLSTWKKCPCPQRVQVKGWKEALHFIEVYSFDCYFART